jgi:hypothetical protein
VGTLRDEDDDDQDQNQTSETVEVEDEKQEATEAEDTRVIEAGGEDDRQDSRLNADEEDDDRQEHDEDDSREGRRKRESAKERRARAKEAKQRDKEELQLLRATIAKQDQRLNQTERALIETRITDLENRATTAQSYVNQWNEVDVKATKAGNVQDAVSARQYRDEAKQQALTFAQQAAQLKQQLAQSAQTQNTPPPFTDLAQKFLRDKSWYNPKSGDEDSLIVEALDKALSKQMNPNTEAYWEELDRRVKAKLPHKFKAQSRRRDDDSYDDEDDYVDTSSEERRPARRKGPPTGGSSRTSGGGTVTEIRLPKEMVESMKEAGQWDDPVKRARVAKRYAEQIRNQRNSRG